METRRRLEGVDSVLHHVGPRTHTVRLGSLPFWAIAEPWALLLWGTRRNTSMRWEAFMEVSEEKLHSAVWVTGEHPDELKSLPSSPKGSSQQWQCLWSSPLPPTVGQISPKSTEHCLIFSSGNRVKLHPCADHSSAEFVEFSQSQFPWESDSGINSWTCNLE